MDMIGIESVRGTKLEEIIVMIEGISHITFIVRDIEKMSALLKYVFDAAEVYSSEEKTFSLSPEKFFIVGGYWIAIMQGDPLKERTYNHVAFKINEADFAAYQKKIMDLGLDFKSPRSRVEGEGQSIYFYDYDNHLFELHTGTLIDRLNRYRKSEANS